jgi:hypothetical protein
VDAGAIGNYTFVATPWSSTNGTGTSGASITVSFRVDVGHSLKDQKLNRRSHLPGCAAWEIHPVMKLKIQ